MLGINSRQSALGSNSRSCSGGAINACELLDKGILLAGDNLLAAGMTGRHAFAAALTGHFAAARLFFFAKGSRRSKASHDRRSAQHREHRQG
ncbi:MAG: hypothetical protein L0Z53_15835 [Acidobacteriales bacterium]|nr:hypothetical protein [Terriglobales bacterium]